MRIDGEWLLCDDGILRPVIRGEILAIDGTWQRAEFLVDPAPTAPCLARPCWRRSVSSLSQLKLAWAV